MDENAVVYGKSGNREEREESNSQEDDREPALMVAPRVRKAIRRHRYLSMLPLRGHTMASGTGPRKGGLRRAVLLLGEPPPRFLPAGADLDARQAPGAA